MNKELQQIAVLKCKLDGFAARLDRKVAEVRRSGHFDDVQEARWAQIRASHRHLYGRLEGLPPQRGAWARSKFELERAFEALAEDLDRIVAALDTTGKVKQK